MELKELANIDLIKQLGLEMLSAKEQEELLLQIAEVVQQRVILRVVENMSGEDKEALNDLLQRSDEKPEEVEKFLRENVPELDTITQEEVGRYKGELMEMIKQITKE